MPLMRATSATARRRRHISAATTTTSRFSHRRDSHDIYAGIHLYNEMLIDFYIDDIMLPAIIYRR